MILMPDINLTICFLDLVIIGTRRNILGWNIIKLTSLIPCELVCSKKKYYKKHYPNGIIFSDFRVFINNKIYSYGNK